MEKKSNKGIIIVLVIIILGLVGYIVYDNFFTKDEVNVEVTATEDNETEEDSAVVETAYAYSDIKGLYTAENGEAKFVLYLWEDGTYYYQYLTRVHSGLAGNYTIVGNEIRLNHMFELGNDAGLRVTEGSRAIKINDDGTLNDSFDETNDSSDFSKFYSNGDITLTKADASAEAEYLGDGNNVNNFDYLLQNYIIDNEAI